jgi:Replication protein C (RepC).
MKTTIYHLLETMGKQTTKQSYKWCMDSLKRLSRCGISYHTDKYRGTTNLLSFSIDKDTNEIHIGINPVSASVFLSNDKYVIHNLTERFSLKMEATKTLQSYLNKQLTPGQTRPLSMDTIIKGIYGDLDDIYNRRRTIKKAIEELVQHKRI